MVVRGWHYRALFMERDKKRKKNSPKTYQVGSHIIQQYFLL
jgi:hypothetical protein